MDGKIRKMQIGKKEKNLYSYLLEREIVEILCYTLQILCTLFCPNRKMGDDAIAIT